MYPYVLSIHIIFVVCWFAGLFYIVRLFIYHAEAQEKPEPDKHILTRQFEMMERRLWNIISVPSMVLAIAAGLTMLYLRPGWVGESWLQVKLCFVLLLLAYHFICQRMMKQMRNGVFNWSSSRLRLWNEVATVLLFAIVFLAVVKSSLSWLFGTAGILVFTLVILAGVKLYKRYRGR